MAVAWVALLAATAAAAVGGTLLGVPSAALFAALLVGLAWALLDRRRLDVPSPVSRAAQAAIGVAVGATVQGPALAALGSEWAPVLVVSCWWLRYWPAGSSAGRRTGEWTWPNG